jgi:hypothetical protein
VQGHHLLHFYGASDKAEQHGSEILIYNITNQDHQAGRLKEEGPKNADADA